MDREYVNIFFIYVILEYDVMNVLKGIVILLVFGVGFFVSDFVVWF